MHFAVAIMPQYRGCKMNITTQRANQIMAQPSPGVQLIKHPSFYVGSHLLQTFLLFFETSGLTAAYSLSTSRLSPGEPSFPSKVSSSKKVGTFLLSSLLSLLHHMAPFPDSYKLFLKLPGLPASRTMPGIQLMLRD